MIRPMHADSPMKEVGAKARFEQALQRGTFFLLAVALGLLSLAYGWTRIRQELRESVDQPSSTRFTPGSPTHDVTISMIENSDDMLNRLAIPFSAEASDGLKYSLSDMLKRGPVVLTFNKVGCPCSVAAQPLFNELASAYPRAQFLGVVDAEEGAATLWLRQVKPSYPQLLDPLLKIVRDYGAENSVYVVLIDRSGRIVEHWPGISRPMLRELSEKLAKLVGSEPKPLKLTDAPEELYSGCPFNP